jgi:hypothetical protein
MKKRKEIEEKKRVVRKPEIKPCVEIFPRLWHAGPSL